ncbi:ferredoxin [Nocardia sp. NPDC051570]|uniref:NADH-quinone oxidoreductase subunit B family protein n=1 Tax=Nocardia sp. NPDC051570 TaxID=3364324 RepID=UPI0037A7D6B3
MPWILRALRDGIVTTRYPKHRDDYADQGVRSVARPLPDTQWDNGFDALCPTSAIDRGDGQVRLDQGRCIGCGACVRARPDVFDWETGSETMRLGRESLIVPSLAETDTGLRELRARLADRTRALRRSVHIRHVDAGSDGADEWEVQALLNPIYDVHRLGIFFTASPRHADILLVTGAGAAGMALPLARTLNAMPRPVVVIAAGTDAISGGLTSPSYATNGGVGQLLPVDVWVPGSPPTPFALLHAILRGTGRLRDPGEVNR